MLWNVPETMVSKLCAFHRKALKAEQHFNEAFLKKTDEYNLDLIVLAGFLVTIPEEMIRKCRNKIINIHPSLIPSFCGVGLLWPEGA